MMDGIIEVSKRNDIPIDYNGLMGVPITIADWLDSDGFIHIPLKREKKELLYKILWMANNAKINGKNLYKRFIIIKYAEMTEVEEGYLLDINKEFYTYGNFDSDGNFFTYTDDAKL